MSRNHTLEVANFICRFGEELVLLDRFHEVVAPAFLKPRERSYSDTTYVLNRVRLLDLSSRGNVEVGLAGRIIKQTKLVREQVYESGRLVQDYREMDTAPSSLFVLLLSNHKLLFVRETAGAPGLSSFESTVSRFLKDAHREYIDRLYVDAKRVGEALSKKSLIAQTPWPTLDIVPVSSGASLADFVKRFAVLNSIEIKLVEPNDELDNSELFRQFRAAKQDVSATSAVLSLRAGHDGLDKGKAIEVLSVPAGEANTEITLKGRDDENERLSGNNEDFKITVPIDVQNDSTPQAARKMHRTYISLIARGLIVAREVGEETLRRLRELRP